VTALWASALLVFLLGASVGSFAGFLASRWPVSPADLWDRSRCDGCSRRLNLVDLIPVVGWLLRRGRCPRCGGRIDPVYPLLELAGGAIGLFALFGAPFVQPLYVLAVGWTLLILAAIDLKTFLLPDTGTLGLILAGLAVAMVDAQLVGPFEAAWGALLGFAALWAIGALYERLRGQTGLGLGDAKLMAAAGAWLGPWGLPQLLLIASWSGLLFALLLRLSGRKLDAKTAIPFGPFLGLGFLIGLVRPWLLTLAA